MTSLDVRRVCMSRLRQRVHASYLCRVRVAYLWLAPLSWLPARPPALVCRVCSSLRAAMAGSAAQRASRAPRIGACLRFTSVVHDGQQLLDCCPSRSILERLQSRSTRTDGFTLLPDFSFYEDLDQRGSSFFLRSCYIWQTFTIYLLLDCRR